MVQGTGNKSKVNVVRGSVKWHFLSQEVRRSAVSAVGSTHRISKKAPQAETKIRPLRTDVFRMPRKGNTLGQQGSKQTARRAEKSQIGLLTNCGDVESCPFIRPTVNSNANGHLPTKPCRA